MCIRDSIGIGTRPALNDYALQVGNIISNEPGYYKDGKYGIRIENDVLVKRVDKLDFEGTKFFTFENLTVVPYCRKLINVKMLTEEEKEQINRYNTHIWNTLEALLPHESITLAWLKRETQPL